eukprot:g14204.t1
MSASRKSVAATVVALGLVTAATAAVVYSKYTAAAGNSRQSGADTEDRQRSSMGEDEAAAAAAPPAPLAIDPAPAGTKALIICKEGSEGASVAEQWATQSRSGGAAVSVCPPGYLDSHTKSNTGSYDSIVVEAGDGLEGAALGQVVQLLKAGGKVNVAFRGDDATAVKRALTFAGFLKVAPCPEDVRVLTGERAAWETGASAPVRLSFSKPAAAAAATSHRNGIAAVKSGSLSGAGASNGNGAPAKKTWKLALDDNDDDGGGLGGGEDDLVDEDALLESAAPVKRASEADGGGCATKRRACKDCSCGRAEMEMNADDGNGPAPLPVVSLDNVDDVLTSACGNCSKGDAFRCSGCPFLGKPAFEKGQEKTIMLADLDAQHDD